MTFSKKSKIVFVLYILSGCLYSLGQCRDTDFRILQNLGGVNQSWFQLTSIEQVMKLSDNLMSNSFAAGTSYEWFFKFVRFLSLFKSITENGSYASGMKEEKCSHDLNHFLSNLKTPWALQMLDSVAKLPSGILRGEYLWSGQYRECLEVYSPLDEKGHGGFRGQYCVSSWSPGAVVSKHLQLLIGLCVPDSCSETNIETALKNVLHATGQTLFPKTQNVTLINVICKNKDKPLDAPGIIYLSVVSILIMLTVVGSLITTFHNSKINCVTRRHSSNGAVIEVNGTSSYQADENLHCRTFDRKSSCDKLYSTHQTVSTLKNASLCFSILDNGRKILDTKRTEGQLLSIHGIRVLSISWIILGHTYLFGKFVAGNRVDMKESMHNFISQVMIFRSTLAVESFFLLSGFLMTYSFLKEASKRKINWVNFYVYRIWRLMPPYLVVTFFYMLIFKHMGSGPFWDENHCDTKRRNWWKDVLLIQNFGTADDTCAEHTWYLAVVIQFYAISPLFLYPLWKWPKIGLTILGSILVASWSVTGMISYSNDLRPIFSRGIVGDNAERYSKNMANIHLIYTKPYCRIGPYIIGIILGYILYKKAEKKYSLNWWQQLFGWVIASFCIFFPLCGLSLVQLTRTISHFYNALAGTSFSIGVAWLIYASETGHGGFITKILSWKKFIPLSRLSYSAYLLHVIIIYGYYTSYLSPVYLTHTVMIFHFIGFFTITFGFSFIFSLVFESPIMNLQKLILKEKQQ